MSDQPPSKRNAPLALNYLGKLFDRLELVRRALSETGDVEDRRRPLVMARLVEIDGEMAALLEILGIERDDEDFEVDVEPDEDDEDDDEATEVE